VLWLDGGMTRYADPERCPDCRSPITPGVVACPACALPLRGETAQRLFTTLSLADELLISLRAAPAPVAAGATSGSHPASPRVTARRTLRATSAPQILLALGAGCLLVAALVFLAVSWSVLGVGGRTATLVGLTVVAGGLAAALARRGLGAGAQSLALVAYGLLTLDVLGADRAGWFGAPSTADLLGLLGAVLVLTGSGGAVAARRTAVATLSCAELVAAIGAGLGTLGVASVDRLPVAPALVLATVLPAALGLAARRLRLAVAAIGSWAVAAASWLSLTGYALGRAFGDDHGWHALWVDGEVWPLLAAAALAALSAAPWRSLVPARVAALAVTHLLLTVALLAPTARLQATPLTLVAIGLLAVTGVVTAVLPRPWGLVNAVTQGVGATGVLAVTVLLVAEAGGRLVDASGPVWAGSAGDVLPAAFVADAPARQPAGWLLPLCVLALAGTGWVLARAWVRVGRGAAGVADLRVGAAVLGASVVAAVTLYPVPLWLVLGMLVALAGAFTAWWLATGSTPTLLPAAVFVAVAVGVSLHADRLSAVLLCAAATLATVVLVRGRVPEVAAAGGVALAGTLAGASWSWTAVAGAAPVWAALMGLLALGGLVLLTPYTRARWASADSTRPLTGLEAGAVLAALALGLAGVQQSPAGEAEVWTSVYLTVAGAVVSTMSLRRDRRELAWAGGALLAAASWVRLWDLGVSSPEAYTLPSAALLVLAGLDRLRRDRSVGTMAALAPGLSLALVPTLLWALVDPVGLRPLLLGLGCLAMVLVGARLGWTAPIALGAAAGAVLLLRLAAPYVGDAVPRWVLIAAAGAVLVALGATWERRLADARSVTTYVRDLR
jgi:hypothetical protein